MSEQSLYNAGFSLVMALNKFLNQLLQFFFCDFFAKFFTRQIVGMKISKADLKKVKMKKRGVEEGATPPVRTAIAKRPRVALGVPSALVRVPVVQLLRSPIGGGDDNEVEVVHIPSGPETILFPGLRTTTAMSRR